MKGGGVTAKAPGWKGAVVSVDGEKRQQDDAVGAADAVEEGEEEEGLYLQLGGDGTYFLY